MGAPAAGEAKSVCVCISMDEAGVSVVERVECSEPGSSGTIWSGSSSSSELVGSAVEDSACVTSPSTESESEATQIKKLEQEKTFRFYKKS